MHRRRDENTLLRRCCGALMCLMLSAAMILPAAVPDDVFAAYSLQDNMQAAGIQSKAVIETDMDDDTAYGSSDGVANESGSEANTANGESSGTDSSGYAGTENENGSGSEKASNVHSLFVSGSASAEASGAAATTAANLAQRIKIDRRKITFKEKIIKGSYYGSAYIPQKVKIKASKNKIKVSWTAPEKTGFDGYIVFRRNLTQPTGENAVEEWTELARVGSSTLSYTDKTASTANTEYRYAVGVYRKISGGTKVSHVSDWASGVTTASSTANVYSVTHKNFAKTGALMIGKNIKISLGYPKSPFSKTLRWTSSDETKATVDETGRVYGVKKGTVTITGKMHTGETFSTTVRIIKGGTSSSMITVMKSWMGYSYANGKHKGIVDIYNSKKPLPVGYTLKYNDAWCDASISAAAIRSGCTALTGRECSVPRHITIFKNLGIWEEDGKVTPKPGDLIVYSWNRSKQPNNASASHIGIVESVKDGTITAIEGNKGSGEVARRYIPVGWGFIRGYAKPNYSDR